MASKKMYVDYVECAVSFKDSRWYTPHSRVETALYMLPSQGTTVESESKGKDDGENPSKRSNTPLDAGNESY